MDEFDILNDREHENWLRIHLPEFATAAEHMKRLRAQQLEEQRAHLQPTADFDRLAMDPAFRPQWASGGEDTQ